MLRLSKKNYLNLFVVFSINFILLGCNQIDKEKSELINKDSLINIIVDMHMSEAVLMEPAIQAKQFVINKPEYFNFVLNKHTVSKEYFQKSLDYYSQNPEEYEKMYEIVIEKITTLQGDFLSLDSLKIDSIK